MGFKIVIVLCDLSPNFFLYVKVSLAIWNYSVVDLKIIVPVPYKYYITWSEAIFINIFQIYS